MYLTKIQFVAKECLGELRNMKKQQANFGATLILSFIGVRKMYYLFGKGKADRSPVLVSWKKLFQLFTVAKIFSATRESQTAAV